MLPAGGARGKQNSVFARASREDEEAYARNPRPGRTPGVSSAGSLRPSLPRSEPIGEGKPGFASMGGARARGGATVGPCLEAVGTDLGVVPAVDVVDTTVDPRRLGAEQEGGKLGNLLGLAHAPERD